MGLPESKYQRSDLQVLSSQANDPIVVFPTQNQVSSVSKSKPADLDVCKDRANDKNGKTQLESLIYALLWLSYGDRSSLNQTLILKREGLAPREFLAINPLNGSVEFHTSRSIWSGRREIFSTQIDKTTPLCKTKITTRNRCVLRVTNPFLRAGGAASTDFSHEVARMKFADTFSKKHLYVWIRRCSNGGPTGKVGEALPPWSLAKLPDSSCPDLHIYLEWSSLSSLPDFIDIVRDQRSKAGKMERHLVARCVRGRANAGVGVTRDDLVVAVASHGEAALMVSLFIGVLDLIRDCRGSVAAGAAIGAAA